MASWQLLLKGRSTWSGAEKSKRDHNKPSRSNITTLWPTTTNTIIDWRFQKRLRLLPGANGGWQKNSTNHHGRLPILSPAKKNYAVVELELLAIQWATENCRLYLTGTDFTTVTDHKLLLGILNWKNLDAIKLLRSNKLEQLEFKLEKSIRV